jgi:WD40 repeat protein
MQDFLLGHTAPVTCIHVGRRLHDGRQFILSGDEDRDIRRWDVHQEQDIPPIKGHRGPVLALALSRDQSRFVSAGRDMAIRTWDIQTGEEIAHTFLHGAEDSPTAAPTDNPPSPGDSPGRSCAGRATHAVVAAFNATGSRGLIIGHDGLPPDSERAAFHRLFPSAGSEYIRYWSPGGDQEPLLTRPHPADERLHLLAYSNCGPLALRSARLNNLTYRLTITDMSTRVENPWPLSDANGSEVVGAFSPDGRRLLLSGDHADACGPGRQALRLWNLRDRTPYPFTFREHEALVTCVAFAPTKCLAASGDRDGCVYVWNVGTGSVVRCPSEGGPEKDPDVTCVCFSPDADFVSWAHRDGSIQLS